MSIDYTNYNPSFKALSYRLRKIIGKCEDCGALNYQPHPITGSMVVLTIHHINHITTDDRRSNLKVLCQRCHLAYHRKAKVSS